MNMKKKRPDNKPTKPKLSSFFSFFYTHPFPSGGEGREKGSGSVNERLIGRYSEVGGNTG